MTVQCDGCLEKGGCHPIQIPFEVIGELVKKNPRIAEGIANLEVVMLNCPYMEETLFARL
jgi:hypothetical protein